MLLSASGQRPFGPAVARAYRSSCRRRSTAAQLFLAGAFRAAVRPVEVVAAAVLHAVRVATGPLAAVLAAAVLLGALLRAVVRAAVAVPAVGAGAGLVARLVVVFDGADLAAAVAVGADFVAEVAGGGVAVFAGRAPDRAAPAAAAAPAAEPFRARPVVRPVPAAGFVADRSFGSFLAPLTLSLIHI